VSAEHGRVVTTDMFTSDDRAVRTGPGRLLLIRKRSATRDLTGGHPDAPRGPELLRAAKA
jgi:hypothetical protein